MTMRGYPVCIFVALAPLVACSGSDLGAPLDAGVRGEAGLPGVDGGNGPLDASRPNMDASVPVSDAAAPIADASQPLPDATIDGGVEVAADGGQQAMDASAEAGADASPGGGDASTDAGLVGVIGPFPLLGCEGLSHTIELAVGGNDLHVILDTGSADLGVAAKGCDSSCDGGIVEYLPGPDASDQGVQAEVSYGAGDISGEVFKDSVQIHGMNDPVTMSFIAIQHADDWDFNPPVAMGCDGVVYPASGIVGIGPLGLSQVGSDFIVNLTSAYPALGNSFAMQQCFTSGKLWFGGFDPATTSAPMRSTTLLANEPYYQVAISDLTLGGTSLGFHQADFGPSLVDSGTSYFFVPTPVFAAVTAQLTANAVFKSQVSSDATFFTDGNGAGPIADPAAVEAMLPSMTLSMPGANGGPMVTLNLSPYETYLELYVDDSGNFFLYPSIVDGGSEVSFVQPDAGGFLLDATIIGANIQATQITVIDRGNGLVGFAPQVGCAPLPARPISLREERSKRRSPRAPRTRR